MNAASSLGGHLVMDAPAAFITLVCVFLSMTWCLYPQPLFG